MRRTRHQLLQLIDADYYGFRDEEDGVLVQVEAEAEAKLRAEVRAHVGTRVQVAQSGCACDRGTSSGEALRLAQGCPDQPQAQDARSGCL